MTYSIYHFFKDLVDKKYLFYKIQKLEDFPFDNEMLSCKNKGQFPDLAVKVNNTNNSVFKGGELIELKDSKSYNIASFNSTIPAGIKDINKIIKNANSSIKKQMEKAGDCIDLVPLVGCLLFNPRKKKEKCKSCISSWEFF